MAPFLASGAALGACWHDSSPLSRLLVLLLLLIAGISPNPGPHLPRSSRPNSDLPRTLQFNINSVNTSRHELNSFLHENDVRVACLQETKLRSFHRDPTFPGYALIRRDRPRDDGGGGLAILVRHDVEYTPVDTSDLTTADSHLEI